VKVHLNEGCSLKRVQLSGGSVARGFNCIGARLRNCEVIKGFICSCGQMAEGSIAVAVEPVKYCFQKIFSINIKKN